MELKNLVMYEKYVLIFTFQFNQQLKKAEGTKTPKVEVTISIDGVAIQDKQTKVLFAI